MPTPIAYLRSAASPLLSRFVGSPLLARFNGGPLLTAVVRGGQLRLTISVKQKVHWTYVLPLNPSYLEGGMIAQPRAVASSFQSALSTAPFPKISEGIAALAGYHALAAVVDIPPSREFRPEEIIPREARRMFSYRPDSSSLSWWRVKSSDKATHRFVLIVTRRAAMQSLRELFSMAGLRLRALDAGPLATARAANVEEGIVVQAESDGGDVVIIKQGTIGLVRSAYWGGDIVDQDTLLARVTDLVERSVVAHNEANPAGPLNVEAPLLLAGAGAEVLGDEVARTLRRPSRSFDPPLELDDDVPVSELAANLGMVLRGVR